MMWTHDCVERIKEWLDEVPTCPACHGTGEPANKYKNWADTVYWKGQLETVCHNCKGVGKV